MIRLLTSTRYLILIPIVGLAVVAALFFIFGGIGLLRLLIEVLPWAVGSPHAGEELSQGVVIFEVVEFVHTFLVGTVLYITAVGLFQLFIKRLDFAGWLTIENTEELETNLIGVIVVVLAVNFMGAIFAGQTGDLLEYGAGIAFPIAALGLFVGLRAWSNKLSKGAGVSKENHSNEED